MIISLPIATRWGIGLIIKSAWSSKSRSAVSYGGPACLRAPTTIYLATDRLPTQHLRGLLSMCVRLFRWHFLAKPLSRTAKRGE